MASNGAECCKVEMPTNSFSWWAFVFAGKFFVQPIGAYAVRPIRA